MRRIPSIVIAGAITLFGALFIGLSIPVGGQQPMILQLASGSSTGSGLDSARSASLANFPLATTATARNLAGVLQTTTPAYWSVVSVPATNSQASASLAAEASVRHVAECISWSADASAAVTAAAGTIVIRDGATGAGTIIWELATAHLVAAAAGIQTIAPQNICGLGLVGTANTAMTAEFNAGVTGEVQAITLMGYNVQ